MWKVYVGGAAAVGFTYYSGRRFSEYEVAERILSLEPSLNLIFLRRYSIKKPLIPNTSVLHFP